MIVLVVLVLHFVMPFLRVLFGYCSQNDQFLRRNVDNTRTTPEETVFF